MYRFISSFYCLALLLASAGQLFGQEQEVLLRIGDVEVSSEEFKFQYRKAAEISSRSGIPLENLEDYLERYINFKIKVVEALSEGRDTLENFQQEFNQYKRELAGPFMQDRQTLDQLVKEAWERNKEEVEASHILFGFANDQPTASDTLEAYNKALEVRTLLEQGHPFDSLAGIFSTEPGANKSGGYLGFFGALQMVYPFETAAYSLEVGEISGPVRTRFGYHLIKVHSRQAARGEARIAHLLIRSVEGMNAEDRAAKEQKAKDLYAALIQQPDQWNQLVLEHSDDLPTRERGGELGWISPGKLIRQMDSTAFALSMQNQLSEPVLSPFGWHILKLMDKADPPSDFEEVKDGLLEQIKRDSRSSLAVERFQNQAKALVGWEVFPEAKNYLLERADESLLKGEWAWEQGDKDYEPVFKAKEKSYDVQEVARFIQANQKDAKSTNAEGRMNELIEAFSMRTIMELYRENLELVEPEYRYLVMEYRDGMLLFETMEQKVWGKSTIDTLGLKNFYEGVKEKYRQKERVQTQFFIARNATSRNYLLNLFEAAEDKEAFRKQYQQEKPGLNLEIDEQSGQFDARVHPWLSEFEQLEPLNALDLDDAYVVAIVDDMIPSYIPELKAIKGQVINDYQEFLEKEWLADLKSRYPVFVNKAVFDEIQKELGRDL